MSEQHDYIEELQQLLDECVVALGSKTLRWDEIVGEICELREIGLENTRFRKYAVAENIELRDFILREGYRECDIGACNCGSFHDYRRHAKLEQLETENANLRELLKEARIRLDHVNNPVIVHKIDMALEKGKDENSR